MTATASAAFEATVSHTTDEPRSAAPRSRCSSPRGDDERAVSTLRTHHLHDGGGRVVRSAPRSMAQDQPRPPVVRSNVRSERTRDEDPMPRSTIDRYYEADRLGDAATRSNYDPRKLLTLSSQ
jgi:hypothetical protein